ncbi:MAG: hypothetical protein ACYDB1_09585 [Acidiferrobacteraceae bacterium]
MSKLVRELEEKVVRLVVKDALAKGLHLAVFADGEELVAPTKDAKEVLNVLLDVDDATLAFYEGKTPDGWVRFVFGNDGWDVISDYTLNLYDDETKEGLLANAQALCDKYAD